MTEPDDSGADMTLTAERSYRYRTSRLHQGVGLPVGAGEAAQALLDSLPRDWDRVEAGAYYDDLQECLGVGFLFWRGDQYVAFLLRDPREAVADPTIWNGWVKQVRRAFNREQDTRRHQEIRRLTVEFEATEKGTPEKQARYEQLMALLDEVRAE